MFHIVFLYLLLRYGQGQNNSALERESNIAELYLQKFIYSNLSYRMCQYIDSSQCGKDEKDRMKKRAQNETGKRKNFIEYGSEANRDVKISNTFLCTPSHFIYE